MARDVRCDPTLDHVRTLVESLDVPLPWHLPTFLAHVETLVDKPITLLPQPGLTGHGFPCGVIIERPDSVTVAYDAASSGYHTDHIVLHEIAHLLLDHTGRVSEESRLRITQQLFTGIAADTVQRVLARTDYDDILESQAELFASLLLSEIETPRSSSVLGRAFFRR